MDNNELVIVRVHTIGIDAITTEVVHIEQDFHVQVLGCLHEFFHLGQFRSDKRAIHFALDTIPTRLSLKTSLPRFPKVKQLHWLVRQVRAKQPW